MQTGRVWFGTMTLNLQIDLPDTLVRKAKRAGLLNSEAVTEWLREEVRRRQAGATLKAVLDKVRAQPGKPMPMKEIIAEVKAVRAERRAREAGH